MHATVQRKADFRWLIFQWRDTRLNKSSASRFDVDLSDRLILPWTGASDIVVSMEAFV